MSTLDNQVDYYWVQYVAFSISVAMMALTSAVTPSIKLYNQSVLYITRKRFFQDNAEINALFSQGNFFCFLVCLFIFVFCLHYSTTLNIIYYI